MKFLLTSLTLAFAIIIQSAQADLTSDSEQIMNNAQQVYPQYFPSNELTQTVEPYLYRFYPLSGIYLGINKNDNGVYLLGGVFGDTPLYIDQTDKIMSSLNKPAGELFLVENAKKENIITTTSGLQYEVLKKGEGSSPSSTDTVTVHYKGKTLNGKEFDSSYIRNAPVTFPLNRVIAGWTEGLQLMNVGAKYRFFIPSNLAYGDRGAGADITPNTVLIFEIELIEF